jgi:hypothetical protein
MNNNNFKKRKHFFSCCEENIDQKIYTCGKNDNENKNNYDNKNKNDNENKNKKIRILYNKNKIYDDDDDDDDEDDDDELFQNFFNLETSILSLAQPSCENLLCDHKIHDEEWYENNKITLTTINTLDDLITLSNYYHCKMRVEYNGVDMKILHNVKQPLIELNNMIGLQKIKEEIVNNIIYFLLSKSLSKEINSDMMHSVITGSPGCGKTTFIDILAKIYVGLGVLQKGQVVKTKRTELIGKFLGHTAVQTQQKITEAYGGILLIDEAYSLGNPEGRDNFSKECLDTLNQELSENKGKFICIIAGYKDALDNSFFRYNEGLKRRFPFRYEIEKYNAEELTSILFKKIEEYGFYGIHKISLWKPQFTKLQLLNLIKENYKFFVNQGGDMETLFLNAKIAQNKRVFLLSKEHKDKLLLIDIKISIEKFIQNNKSKNNNDDFLMRSMYL